MPITVKSLEPSVQNAPLPNVRGTAALTEEAAGAGIGKAISSFGVNMYQDELHRQDQVAFLDADRKLSEWEQARLYDPQNGALAKGGKDTLGLPEQVGQEYQTKVDELRKSLVNERQQVQFDRSVESRRRDLNGTLSKHVFTEMRKFENTETENYIKTEQQGAILAAGDPERVQMGIDRQKAAITDFATRNGLAVGKDGGMSQYLKQRYAQIDSDTHVGVIMRFLAQGNDKMASDYFNGTGDAGASLLKSAPGMVEPGNIDVKKRPVAVQPDGSFSTVRSMSFEESGKQVVVPTVANDGHIMSNSEAIDEYRKSGKSLGKFEDVNSANAFAEALHQAQATFYGGAKRLIAGDDITKVETAIKTSVTEGAGLRGATDIWTALGPKSDIDPVNLDAMMKKAETTYADNMQVLKSVKQGLVEHANVHNAAQRERHEANGSVVWGAIEKGANLASVRQMPEYIALPGKDQAQIKEHIVQKARSDTTWAEGRGNDALYYQRLTEATSTPLQDQFATRNLLEDRAQLSKAQFNHLAEIQGSIRKGDTKNADKLMASDRVQNNMVNEALLRMRLDPTPNEKTSKDKIEQITGFRRAVRESVSAIEARTGKPATDADVQSIVDGFVIEAVTKPGILWNDTKRVYQVQPGESIQVKVTDVPKAERAKIEDSLRRNGRAITDQAVTNLYQQRLYQMRRIPDPNAVKPITK